MLRINPCLKRFAHGTVFQKRFFQTAQQQQQVATISRLNYAAFTAATLIAAGSGYWYGSKKQQLQQQQQDTTPQQQHTRPQVPVPAIPSHETITKAFNELRQVLPAEHVSVDEESLQDHGYSSNSYHNEGAPNIVVFPKSTHEVAEIVKIANKFNLPIIPFSGGTSLEGHFSAPKGGICISFTEHMDQVVAFHPQDMDIVVQPGIQWEDLNFYLKKQGLFFPMDPGPGACIGGMVGTSCSGTNAVRYGTMREWVINLTVVTPEGKILKTRQRPRKSSAGYDLTKLFIGSEGTLGVVTEITLKLAVLPQEETVAVCDFPTIRDAAAVVPDLVRAGVQIGAVELLDAQMMKAINLANPELGHSEKPTLFFKFSGGSKVIVDHEIKVVSEIAKKHQGGTFKYAKNDAEKADLWEGRKIALWSSTLLKPEASVWTTDVVVPVSKLPDLIAETTKDLEDSFLPCPMVGHVGDGNFHVFILFKKDDENEYAEAKRLNKNLLERAIRMEGSVTGEHGVGIGKKMFLNQELGENTVDMMKTIKIALDPKGLMNPEKVLPDN
ncbi:D-lactate (cytochrome) dehydrogenase [Mucor ambiguus]|uniref:D-lactate dehydrogenase (cytochrome) n=1 Tax=Mucor ambiguus TaxID=91626 RepID=A0A0C9MFN8_9FUNG|nr:D-lactate (cytochrome) dehydrogenase [Mucor ambiguus]